MAAALVAKGLQPGDRVAAQIEKSPQGLVLYLGTLLAGGVFLPLNTAYTSGELDYFLGDAEPAIVVCDPGKREAIAGIAGTAQVETLGADGRGSMATAAEAAAPNFMPVARTRDDLAAILYTSGTTGRSKGAMLTHDNLISNAIALADIWRFTSNDVLLHALPIYHTHGLFVACNTLMRSGASLIFLPKFEPAAMLREMPAASVMMGVPTFYTRLLDREDFTRDQAKHMRLFVSGSAPLLAETHRDWSERTGHAILERYGMTETNMNSSNPYDGERRPGTVGFPLPGVDLRVADPDTGRDLGRETIGVIEVRGPNVFKGYWRLPEKTAGRVPCGRLLHHRRSRRDRCRRLRPHRRPRQGPDHLGRFQRLPEGGRARDRRARRRAGERGDRPAAQGFRRRRGGGGGAAAGRVARRVGDPERSRRPARQVQAAEARDARRRSAAQRDGQGAEGRAAGSAQGCVSLKAPFPLAGEGARRADEGSPPDRLTPLRSQIRLAVEIGPERVL